MHLPRYLAVLSPIMTLLILAAGTSSPQTEKKLSAREIFYSAQAEPPPAKKAAPPPAAAAKKKAVESAKAKPVAQPLGPAATQGSSPPAGEIVPASYTSGTSSPLGIRYSILRREGSGSAEVSPDAVFRSGDRIRLRVEVTSSGYLYVIHRGSSGVWKPLFPAPETAGGDNRVERGKTYEIPSGYVFTFDEQPGQEKLFIVLSRRPEPDLEKLIYSLSDSKGPATPAKPEEGRLLLAQNLVNIDNGLVDRMRKVYARDLIIEKVDEASPVTAAAPAKETAVYVVNPSRAGDSRVVADVTLTHK